MRMETLSSLCGIFNFCAEFATLWFIEIRIYISVNLIKFNNLNQSETDQSSSLENLTLGAATVGIPVEMLNLIKLYRKQILIDN
jgi:hypothetical protein